MKKQMEMSSKNSSQLLTFYCYSSELTTAKVSSELSSIGYTKINYCYIWEKTQIASKTMYLFICQMLRYVKLKCVNTSNEF